VTNAEVSLEGEVQRVTFENPQTGFRVIKITVAGRDGWLSVIGAFPQVGVGSRVRVRGTMERDREYGEQIRASSVTELRPSTLDGIVKYLGSGAIKGVGERYAGRIVERFGLETLRVLDEEPDRLSEVEGLGPKRVEAIRTAWREQQGLREVMVFLQSHGASAALAARIHKRYGDRALAIVSSDPYRLAVDVWGIGFRTADRIASSLGVAKDSDARVQAGVLQVLRDLSDAGHTWAPASAIEEHASRLLGDEQGPAALGDRVHHAVDDLARSGHVSSENVDGTRIVQPAALWKAETRIAERLVALLGRDLPKVPGAEAALAELQKRTGVELAPEQREAVISAAREGALVVTGGPGVGKTTIVRAILDVFEKAGVVVRLGAPTGRAAKRMAEATGRDAQTLHRLLEFDPKAMTFKRDAGSPLAAGAVIVDETSMVDVHLADALLQAIGDGTRLVLVGDVDQLPSVGPGAVLRDLLDCGKVPSVRLTRIFRQAEASLIVQNAHRINQGEPPELPPPGKTDADFFVVERRDPDAALETILELVRTRIPRRFGLDPVRDVQVLVPMHRGVVGSVGLNAALQRALNPVGPSVERGGIVYRLGDKVMQLKNDYERGVYNGDVGVVTKVDEEQNQIGVRFDDLGGPEVVYDGPDLDQLNLAYACTVHKSQGSEYPAVVVAMLSSHFVMLSKNLLYTAVTRGKRLVVLVADPRAIRVALSNERAESDRRTRLSARIHSLFREPGELG